MCSVYVFCPTQNVIIHVHFEDSDQEAPSDAFFLSHDEIVESYRCTKYVDSDLD